jgi:hypothetical protein
VLITNESYYSFPSIFINAIPEFTGMALGKMATSTHLNNQPSAFHCRLPILRCKSGDLSSLVLRFFPHCGAESLYFSDDILKL